MRMCLHYKHYFCEFVIDKCIATHTVIISLRGSATVIISRANVNGGKIITYFTETHVMKPVVGWMSIGFLFRVLFLQGEFSNGIKLS